MHTGIAKYAQYTLDMSLLMKAGIHIGRNVKVHKFLLVLFKEIFICIIQHQADKSLWICTRSFWRLINCACM